MFPIPNSRCCNWPEPDLLQVEGVLDDTGGGDPDPEDVLLRADVVRRGYSVDVRQVAEGGASYTSTAISSTSTTPWTSNLVKPLLTQCVHF